jgi:putative transposase
MPRANRYYIFSHIWHITHQCHKTEFLLKFKCDQERWFYLTILDYIVTSDDGANR